MDTKPGYISLATHPERPGRLRCQCHPDHPPAHAPEGGAAYRYISHYPNLFRGWQQTHTALSAHCINVDDGLYRVDLIEAIAAIESAPYPAERHWIDPHIDEREQQQLARSITARQQKRARTDRIWRWVGMAFAAALLMRGLGLY